MAIKYAISDIHGCRQTFESLLDKIAYSKSDSLFLLGDYIDRGPDSKGVIDLIFSLQAQGYHVQCLRGNHEQMLLDGTQEMDVRISWLRAGGQQTLESYGTAHLKEIPETHRTFFEQLPYYVETDGYVLVHAGLTFLHPDPLQEKHGMIWQRGWYPDINYEWLQDRIIVHGHTPQSVDETRTQLRKLAQQQYLNIDNGCVYHGRGKGFGLGYLAAFNLTERKLHWMENQEN